MLQIKTNVVLWFLILLFQKYLPNSLLFAGEQNGFEKEFIGEWKIKHRLYTRKGFLVKAVFPKQTSLKQTYIFSRNNKVEIISKGKEKKGFWKLYINKLFIYEYFLNKKPNKVLKYGFIKTGKEVTLHFIEIYFDFKVESVFKKTKRTVIGYQIDIGYQGSKVLFNQKKNFLRPNIIELIIELIEEVKD